MYSRPIPWIRAQGSAQHHETQLGRLSCPPSLRYRCFAVCYLARYEASLSVQRGILMKIAMTEDGNAGIQPPTLSITSEVDVLANQRHNVIIKPESHAVIEQDMVSSLLS